MNNSLQIILNQVSTVAIGGHLNPDGDATGSCMALYLYLSEYYPDIQVDVYLENVQTPYLFLKEIDKVKGDIDSSKKYDLFVALDCGDKERLGFLTPLFDNAKKTFNIDHHISNQGFADDNYVKPQASSTAELVYELIAYDRASQQEADSSKRDSYVPSQAVAEAIYLGIVHDTGVFRYPSTSPQTMEIAANLIRAGINGPKIIDETYFEKTFAQTKILGRAIDKARLYLDNVCIASIITQEDINEFGLTTHDLDGIINILKGTAGCHIAIFMYQLDKDKYKVSLRSNEQYNVNIIAAYFGGGGHIRAAGLTLEGKQPEEILTALFNEIRKQD